MLASSLQEKLLGTETTIVHTSPNSHVGGVVSKAPHLEFLLRRNLPHLLVMRATLHTPTCTPPPALSHLHSPITPNHSLPLTVGICHTYMQCNNRCNTQCNKSVTGDNAIHCKGSLASRPYFSACILLRNRREMGIGC